MNHWSGYFLNSIKPLGHGDEAIGLLKKGNGNGGNSLCPHSPSIRQDLPSPSIQGRNLVLKMKPGNFLKQIHILVSTTSFDTHNAQAGYAIRTKSEVDLILKKVNTQS